MMKELTDQERSYLTSLYRGDYNIESIWNLMKNKNMYERVRLALKLPDIIISGKSKNELYIKSSELITQSFQTMNRVFIVIDEKGKIVKDFNSDLVRILPSYGLYSADAATYMDENNLDKFENNYFISLNSFDIGAQLVGTPKAMFSLGLSSTINGKSIDSIRIELQRIYIKLPSFNNLTINRAVDDGHFDMTRN